MSRAKIRRIIPELDSWLPNYDRGPDDYPTVLLRLLASLPGGDRLMDLGYQPYNIGWHEADQLARTIDAIDDRQDIEELVDGLLAEEED
jgi:hypothetical protein